MAFGVRRPKALSPTDEDTMINLVLPERLDDEEAVIRRAQTRILTSKDRKTEGEEKSALTDIQDICIL